jgi:hypothetical protein
MNKINALKICCFILLCLPFFAAAQTVKEIEQDLLKSLKRIDRFAYPYKRTDETAFVFLILNFTKNSHNKYFMSYCCAAFASGFLGL